MTPQLRPPDAVPTAARKGRNAFLWAAAKTVLLPTALVGTLLVFGQPALRFQYWYRGSDVRPDFTRCIYLALDGWHDLRLSGYSPGACPLVALFPIDFNTLLGGL